MKPNIMAKRADFDEIPRGATEVIMTFRPSVEDILDIVEKGPRVRTIKVAKSLMPSIGRTPTRVAYSHGIKIVENEENMRGKRTDLVNIKGIE